MNAPPIIVPRSQMCLVVKPPVNLISESIKLRKTLQSDTPYQEQVAVTAHFLSKLPKNSHYDIKGLIEQLMGCIIKQLGVRRQGAFKVSMHRDIKWVRAIQVMKDLSHHTVPLIADAAREQLKQLQFDYRISSKPIHFVTETIHGDPLSFGTYRSRVVLFHFGKLGCPACTESVNRLKKIYDRWHIRGLEIIGVAVDSKKENLLKRSLKWPHVIESSAEEDALHRRLKIENFPQWHLFDKRGLLVSANLDLHDDLPFEIERLIKEKV